MPTPLKPDQRQVLINAGRNVKGQISDIHARTGESLERRGFGHYEYHNNRTFYLNNQGLAFVLAWEKRNSQHDKP